MTRKILLVLLPVLLISAGSFSQGTGFPDYGKALVAADSQTVVLHIGLRSFFKNNEYFNKIHEGYTLPGFVAEPSVSYQAGSSFTFEGGIRLLKYDGRDGIFSTQPLFRVNYQPNTWFRVVMGSLYSGTGHQLSEPLYRWERVFTHPFENGIQFLFNAPQFQSDIWLNWEKFITQGDPFQEEFTTGLSNAYTLNLPSLNGKLTVPFQALFNHHGGQINSNDVPLRTISNWATGFVYNHFTGSRFFRSWNIETMYYGFADLSPQKLQLFHRGFALYPAAGAQLGSFLLKAGYFYGYHFMAPMGETLFHSANMPFDGISRPQVRMVTGKFSYRKNISSDIALEAYFESYSNLSEGLFDYDYGFHIFLSSGFFLFRYKGLPGRF